MENAIKAAAQTVAELLNMTEIEVLQEIQNGNESIRNSVMMLVFAVA